MRDLFWGYDITELLLVLLVYAENGTTIEKNFFLVCWYIGNLGGNWIRNPSDENWMNN